MRLRDRILNAVFTKVFKYRDIVKHVEGKDELYLRRFFIFRTRMFPNFRIFLHFINRSDDDRHLHDHPWDFTSLILAGGYDEELPPPQWLLEDMKKYADWKVHRYLEVREPGDILRNKAEHTHRVQLRDGKPAWTLVQAGKARRIWGFHTESGWVDWRKYLGLDAHHPDSPEDV